MWPMSLRHLEIDDDVGNCFLAVFKSWFISIFSRRFLPSFLVWCQFPYTRYIKNSLSCDKYIRFLFIENILYEPSIKNRIQSLRPKYPSCQLKLVQAINSVDFQLENCADLTRQGKLNRNLRALLLRFIWTVKS